MSHGKKGSLEKVHTIRFNPLVVDVSSAMGCPPRAHSGELSPSWRGRTWLEN